MTTLRAQFAGFWKNALGAFYGPGWPMRSRGDGWVDRAFFDDIANHGPRRIVSGLLGRIPWPGFIPIIGVATTLVLMGSMPPEKIVAKPIADPGLNPEPILLVGAVKGVGCHPTLGLHVVKNPGVDEGEMFNTIVSETFRKSLIVVIGIHEHREHDLALIGFADGTLALFLCLAQCWEQHRSEYRYDGNDNKQFNQSESSMAESFLNASHEGRFAT